MKKNIGYINLDSSTALWLQKHLPDGDLKKGIQELLERTASSLMIELGETPSFADAGLLQLGSLSIDSRRRLVTRSGTEISLTPKEFDILWFLACNRGEVFTKEQIYQAVWD